MHDYPFKDTKDLQRLVSMLAPQYSQSQIREFYLTGLLPDFMETDMDYWILIRRYYALNEKYKGDAGVDSAALPMAYWMCFLFAILTVGLILTFVKGPDGQSIFFNMMLIGQIGSLIGNLIEYATGAATKSPPALMVLFIVVAALYCFRYFRLRSRL